MPAPITRNQLTDFWHDHYLAKDGLCGLCANHGIIDTTDNLLLAPNGRPAAGGRFFCICPNGQTMKRGGAAL